MRIQYIENISGASITLGTTVIGIGVKIDIDGTDVYSNSGEYLFKELTLGSVFFYDETDTLIPSNTAVERKVIYTLLSNIINDVPVLEDGDAYQREQIDLLKVQGASGIHDVADDGMEGDLLIRKADGTYEHIHKDVLSTTSKKRVSFVCGNRGIANNTEGMTYIDAGPLDNTWTTATATDEGSQNGSLHSFAGEMALVFDTLIITADTCAVGHGTPDEDNITIRIDIFTVEAGGRTLIETVKVPIMTSDLTYIRNWGNQQSLTKKISASILAQSIVIPDNSDWGITFKPVTNDPTQVSTLGRYKVTLIGEI